MSDSDSDDDLFAGGPVFPSKASKVKATPIPSMNHHVIDLTAPSPPPPPPPHPHPSNWTCPRCTLDNMSSASYCSACDFIPKNRPPTAASFLNPPAASNLSTKPAPKRLAPPQSNAPNKKPSHPFFSSRAQTIANLRSTVHSVLTDVFEMTEMQGLQKIAIDTALERRNQIVIMRTGGGKSLCFQLPAVVFSSLAPSQQATTIVVSPLISLMLDQVLKLKSLNIPADFISSTNSASHNADVVANMSSLSLLYVTPELLETEKFRTSLRALHRSNKLAMFALDEVHCLSSWGHDFRPAYLKLSYLREAFPSVPIIACTATATPRVVEDIKKTLKFGAETPVHKASFNRANIFYSVRYKDVLDQRSELMDQATLCTASSSTQSSQNSTSSLGGFSTAAAFAKTKAGKSGKSTVFQTNASAAALSALTGSEQDLIRYIVQQHAPTSGAAGAGFFEAPPRVAAVIYVHSRKDTTALSSLITKFARVKAVAYHAGLKDAVRSDAQRKWMSGEAPICVATIAFGMGIDLACVRYVVHWNMPKNVEGFYQESGRAGRDGLPAESIVYFSKKDARSFAFLINKGAKGRKGGKSNSVDKKMESFDNALQYCLTEGCRRCYLLKHFGERSSVAGCKKTCDFCKDPNKVEGQLRAASSTGTRTTTTFAAQPFEGKGNGGEPGVGEYDVLASDESGSENSDGGMFGGDDDENDDENDDPFFSDDEPAMPPTEATEGRSAADILSKYEFLEYDASSKNFGGRRRKGRGKGGFKKFRKGQSDWSSVPTSAVVEPPVFKSKTATMLASSSQGFVMRKENTFETVRQLQQASSEFKGKSAAELQADVDALKAKIAMKKKSLPSKPLPTQKRAPPPPPKRMV